MILFEVGLYVNVNPLGSPVTTPDVAPPEISNIIGVRTAFDGSSPLHIV